MANNEDHHTAASQISNDDNLFVTPANDNMAMDTDPVEPPEDINMDADIHEPSKTVPTDNDPDPAGQISDMPSDIEVTHSESVAQAADHGAETARLLREAALKKQKYFAQKFREKKAVQEATMDSNDVPDEDEDTDNHTKTEQNARGKYAISAKFKRQKQKYLKKQGAGRLTDEDEIAFMRAEHEETARLRKLQADEEFDKATSGGDSDDGGLFVDQQPSKVTYAELHSDDEQPAVPKKKGRKRAAEDADDEKPRKRSKPKNPSKKDRKVAGTGYTEGDVENVMKEAKKQSKVARKPKQPAKGKDGKAKAKNAGPNMVNFNSLLGTNIFNDAAAVSNLPAQPGFTEGREGGTKQRSKALKQLIASVPTDSKDAASSDAKALDAAMKDFDGQGSVYPKGDGTWGVKGLRASLKHYQVLGTAFMRRREKAGEEPRGGILADEMGLGKTVMMLANIVNGKFRSGKGAKTTLIIASPALVSQWAREIRNHCQTKRESKHGIGMLLEQRAGHRVKEDEAEDVLPNADIVLTTYHEVMTSYPKAIVPTELTTSAQKEAWWNDFYEANKGILHRIKWHRVVLDEAQAIKNHKSHTSMACRALTARHYWAITGTPVMNNIKEFYSYLKLIREPNTGSFRIFSANFCNPEDDDGVEKLRVFLRKVMVRRTHLDRLFDARLLELPQPHENNLWVEFSEIERQIYEIVKKRFIQRINKIAKQDGLQKKYNHIWTMILRLRQICCHVLTIQGTVIDLLEREDFEKLNSLTQQQDNTGEEGSALLSHLRMVLANNEGVKMIEGGLGNSVLTEKESLVVDVTKVVSEGDIGSAHGLSYQFGKYLQALKESEHWEVIKERTTCCACRQLPQNPHVTSCFHIYCWDCLERLQHTAARRAMNQATCTECGEPYTGTQPCEDLETFQYRDTSTSTAPASGQKVKKDDSWIGMRGEVLPSAKTRAVKAQILNWIEEQADVKIIIYTQFLDVVRILAKVCVTEGWSNVTYTGAMSHDARDNAIHKFSKASGMCIMIASLKCGGQGLNLTCASRVICLDPWWNLATENQAFARVYRIGQVQETKFLRVLVKNTIDAAITATKERKQVDIDAVMQQKGNVDVHDLMRLFGAVGEDEEGHPFIFAEGADRYDELDPNRLVEDDENDEMGFMGNEA